MCRLPYTPLPCGVTQNTLFSQQQKCSNMNAMSLSRQAHSRIKARDFIGGWSQSQAFYWGPVTKPGFYWGPPPSTYQNSRLPEGRQVFIVNHMVFVISPGTVSQPYQLGDGDNTPRARFPDARQGPTLQAGLPKDSSSKPAPLTLSCTVAHKVTICFHLMFYRENFHYYEMFLKTMILMIEQYCLFLDLPFPYSWTVRLLLSICYYNYLMHICKHKSL